MGFIKDETRKKVQEFSDLAAKESMSMGTLKYKGYKDSEKGTTERSLSVEGGCSQSDAKFGLQGWDIEGATLSEDGKSVVIGASKDLDVAPRWKEGEEYVFAVMLWDFAREETAADVDHEYSSKATKILLGGMSLAAAGAATLATLLTF